MLSLRKKIVIQNCIYKLLLHKNDNGLRVRGLISLELDENSKFQVQFIILSINGTIEIGYRLVIVY